MRKLFNQFASKIADITGSYSAFIAGVAVVLLWAASGPFFGFSETWQLVINTGTTILTFLMMFIIQYTQTRDTKAIHAKLDDLIKVNLDAHDELIDIERLDVKDIDRVRKKLHNDS